MNLREERNKACKNYVKRPTHENHLILKEIYHMPLNEKCKAKRECQCLFAEQGQNQDFKRESKRRLEHGV
jgi:hypothetical protein